MRTLSSLIVKNEEMCVNLKIYLLNPKKHENNKKIAKRVHDQTFYLLRFNCKTSLLSLYFPE